jgi:hypothetical protein
MFRGTAMSNQAIPKLERRQGDAVVVTHHGQVAGMTLRPGDWIVVGPEAPGALLVLVARGYGAPMIGRRAGGRLFVEPSGVPASPDRWRVAGALVAVERDHERGGLAQGTWCLAAVTTPAAEGVEPVAPAAFEGMGLTSEQVDERCLLAALAPDRWDTNVALAAADTLQEARALVARTPPGRIRYAAPSSAGGPSRQAVGADVPAGVEPRGIVVPFGARVAPHRQLTLFA